MPRRPTGEQVVQEQYPDACVRQCGTLGERWFEVWSGRPYPGTGRRIGQGESMALAWADAARRLRNGQQDIHENQAS